MLYLIAAAGSSLWAEITALLTALALFVGALFALRKFRGEKVSAVITQQSTLLSDMRTLYETLETTAARLRAEAALNGADLVACRVVIKKLKARIADLEQQIEDRLRANGFTEEEEGSP